MGRCILRLEAPEGHPIYLEWSTVVDAPVTYAMTREELEEHIREEEGNLGLQELPARLERADRCGASWKDGFRDGAEDTIAGNRAGPNETELTMTEIVRKYWTERPESER